MNFIDWTPFFRTWELPGRYPSLFEHADVGPQARELFADAQTMLADFVGSGQLQAKAVLGLFPASRQADDIVIWSPDRRVERPGFAVYVSKLPVIRPPQCGIGGFHRQEDSGVEDELGAFVVTAGLGLDAIVQEFDAQHDDYRSILAGIGRPLGRGRC